MRILTFANKVSLYVLLIGVTFGIQCIELIIYFFLIHAPQAFQETWTAIVSFCTFEGARLTYENKSRVVSES